MKVAKANPSSFYLAARNRVAVEMTAYFLESEGFSVSGMALTTADCLQAVQQQPPAVLMVGSEMPDGSGLSLLRTVRERHPAVRRILFLHAAEPDYVMSAYEEGLDGLLTPACSREQVLACAEAVCHGKRYVAAHLADLLRQRFGVSVLSDDSILSPREQEILRLVAAGLNSAGIAGRLGLSQYTVGNHRSSIIRKLRLAGHNALERYVNHPGYKPGWPGEPEAQA